MSSAKQCGRAVVSSIAEPRQFNAITGSSARTRGEDFPSPVFILVEPNTSAGVALAELESTIPNHATLVIGPEGGWTAEELQIAAGLGTLITLGQRTLRADAMALVALSANVLAIEVGDSFPDEVELHLGFPPTKINVKERVAGKNVILVGLPGAFTPTCSTRQVRVHEST